jgi:hypothetical protein
MFRPQYWAIIRSRRNILRGNYVDIGGQVIVHAKLQRDLVVTLCCYSQGVFVYQTTQIKVLKATNTNELSLQFSVHYYLTSYIYIVSS